MSDFAPGFAARHDPAVAAVLAALVPAPDFAPIAICAVRRQAPGPRHFSPADRATNPTAGWDPLDCTVQSTHIDPLAAAHAAGYAEGLAAATAAAKNEQDRDETLVAGLAAELGGIGCFDREAVAQRLRETVLALVTRLVGEAGVSAELLEGRITAATELMADAAESAMLRLHPDDVALVGGRLPRNVFAVGDAGVARGGFVLESASTIVEDGPTLWLDQLASAIDKVAVPRS